MEAKPAALAKVPPKKRRRDENEGDEFMDLNGIDGGVDPCLRTQKQKWVTGIQRNQKSNLSIKKKNTAPRNQSCQ